ncbi:MAG: 6-phosphofructokinase [bacterium]
MATQHSLHKVGILTGGGDCPGLNAAIRAVAKPAILDYGMEIIGIKDGFAGLVQNKTVRLDYEDVSGILTRGGTILGTSNKADPFRWPEEKKEGETIFRDLSSLALKNYHELGLDCLFCIGGDGTLTAARKFHELGLNIIGIPKTIDNDLSGTDLSFGFDTAVLNATEAIDKIHTTAESHHRVMVVETMGRYAGWIALHAGLAGGGDIILIPEIPYDPACITAKIRERGRRGKRYSIIVVAEGAKAKGGEMTVDKVIESSPDPIRLGGIGRQVAELIETSTGIETRVTVLGHLLRGGTPTPFDRILATRFGVKALELAVKGHFGQMACLHGQEISSVPLSEAVNRLRLVPPDSALVKTAREVGTSMGDE